MAWRLAKSDQSKHLVYIERPLPITSFLKFLICRADRDGSDRWRRVLRNRSWEAQVHEKLSVLTTFAPLPPIGIAPLFNISERFRDRWLLKHLRKHFELNRPLVCISHPQISPDVIQALEPCILWYDCTEDFSAIPGLPDCVQAQIQTADYWLTHHADVITAVSRTLYEEKRQVNPNTHWLPNAVDIDLFLKPPKTFNMPLELQGVSQPILAFVGGLNDWAHDWELLDNVAALRPDWTILLIGTLSVRKKTKRMLRSHSNILCVGQKPYYELPTYLVHSDVCFQFYKPSRENNTRNSQKLFLYLAAGKSVVSTRSADALAYANYLSLVEGTEDFVTAVEKSISTDSSAKFQDRQELAKANSWAARVQQINDILDSLRKDGLDE